jgi:hypothetical protein
MSAIGGDEAAEAGSLAMPLMTVSLGFLLIAAGLRFTRQDLRAHVYVMALAVAVSSLAAAQGVSDLTTLSLVYVAAWLLAGVLEDSPIIAAPAAVFAFIAVPVGRAHVDAPMELVPVAYTAIGAGAYAAAMALRSLRAGVLPSAEAWSLALRAAGGVFAVSAPAIGFVMLSEQEGIARETSALYQWSTVGVAVCGLIALVEASVGGRRWVVVPATAVLTVALLLQIGRAQPENVQAYTAVIGAYLVMLGVVGLGRLKLMPELTPYASYIEGLGAATIMLPSFVQSIDGAWHYQWILLVEATLFLAASVALRRRGLLGASILFLVLVAGRAMFDAVNALPNWIVVALCGAGLLAGGVAILAGRERWDRWQQTIIGWWDEMGTEPSEQALNGQ